MKKILLVRRPEVIVKLQELQDKNPPQANKQKVNGEYTKKQQRKMSPPKLFPDWKVKGRYWTLMTTHKL